jgi:spermidine/putrescine transport system substrate-binding protein
MRTSCTSVAVLAASLALAACGGNGDAERIGAGADVPVIPRQAKPDRVLNFANWPYYIDVGPGGRHPTLDAFRRRYGTTVRYFEDIQSNESYFDSIRSHLASRESIGRDLIVLTDSMASRMIQLGYVQRLDHSVLPNVDRNLADSLREPSYDPGRQFTVPWQTGVTGLAIRTDLAPGVDSVADVFDPRYRGKVSMIDEMEDCVGLVMLALGDDPSHFDGIGAALKGMDRIESAVRSGHVRRFIGDDYTDLIRGRTWISFAYSGDIPQLQAKHPNIEFVLPKEGGIFWSDDMLVPVGAEHPYTAELFMNYVYDPKVQADITEYVQYISPVKGVRGIIAKRDPKLARNPLVFPTAETLKKAHTFKVLTPDEDRVLRERFNKITHLRPGLTQG